MKTFLFCIQILIVACCVVGCNKKQEVDQQQAIDAHQALHTTKYNQVLVEFPGHKYSMEIIVEEESHEVTAFLTNAHFEVVDVSANEVKLDFIVASKPKSFTLVRTPQDDGQPVKFILKDAELATLIKDGWEVEASAFVVIDGKDNVGKLADLRKKDSAAHDHSEPGHSH
ncbi:MAG: hypothetical protein FWG02_08100 [Holophagaceae bacterium]|nr:hypothetical protein [Holophagaceae bacterium]